MKLSTQLLRISNQVIDNVLAGKPEPKTISKLVEWIESEAWDDLSFGWIDDQIVLNLSYLSWLKFSDSELIDSQEVEEQVNDNLRVVFAKQLISDTFEANDGYICPTVHGVEIRKSDGATAILGWTMEIHGQGGAVAIFQGAFLDKQHFYQHLRDANFIFDTEQNEIPDVSILRLWNRPPVKDKSIVLSAMWGNEQHECPVSAKTWKRILQGKAVRRVEPYLYEGKKYKAEWLFHHKGQGKLTVNYDDGGVGFDGHLSEIQIVIQNEITTWENELNKFALK